MSFDPEGFRPALDYRLIKTAARRARRFGAFRLIAVVTGIPAIFAVALSVELPFLVREIAAIGVLAALIIIIKRAAETDARAKAGEQKAGSYHAYLMTQMEAIVQGRPSTLDSTPRWSGAWCAVLYLDLLSATCVGALTGSLPLGLAVGGAYLLATREAKKLLDQTMDEMWRLGYHAARGTLPGHPEE